MGMRMKVFFKCLLLVLSAAGEVIVRTMSPKS